MQTSCLLCLLGHPPLRSISLDCTAHSGGDAEDLTPAILEREDGGVQGGALACLNNPICRGFQICWAFPTGSDIYSQAGIIRLKAGAQAPLNVTSSLQNPYCSVYVLKSGTASSPNSGQSGYSLRDASNITAVSAAANKIGRRLKQAPAGMTNCQLNPDHASFSLEATALQQLQKAKADTEHSSWQSFALSLSAQLSSSCSHRQRGAAFL